MVDPWSGQTFGKLWQRPCSGFSFRIKLLICLTLFQVVFLSFDVFVFNRMRHNGLLLLVCCWLAPGFRQLKKLGIKKTLP